MYGRRAAQLLSSHQARETRESEDLETKGFEKESSHAAHRIDASVCR
jgi:hypothetical protein